MPSSLRDAPHCCTADWGTSPFQSLGACVAAAAKSAKAKTAAVALVDSPLAGAFGRCPLASMHLDLQLEK